MRKMNEFNEYTRNIICLKKKSLTLVTKKSYQIYIIYRTQKLV